MSASLPKGELTEAAVLASEDPAIRKLAEPLVFKKYQPHLRVLNWVACIGMTGYLVLFHDFGPKEHCFMPIRRWMHARRTDFLTPSAEEQRRIDEMMAKTTAAATVGATAKEAV